MIIIKTDEEIKKMKKAGELLANIHKEISKIIKPGITTMEIDQFAEKYMKDRGAKPAQIGYHGYKYATCASINDEICHGFPRETPLKDGDLVTIDMVVDLDGWMADSAWTYAVGNVSEDVKKLMKITKEALYKGIEMAKPGNRLGDIGHAIQSYVEENGYSIVRDFVGHGIGKSMHEEPQVLHYGTPGRGQRLEEGMTLTIEPMVNIGDYKLTVDEDDGWTARTLDGSLSAQYEHTIAIRKEGAEILTDQD